tara:strand:- start:4 stop:234 length:231 start_codon:yes stop_codon:yes gene_type:complete
LNRKIINDFYLLALQDISDGASIKDLEKAIFYYEAVEDYEACAGILKAIKEIDKNTINAIKIRINEIRENKRNSRK